MNAPITDPRRLLPAVTATARRLLATEKRRAWEAARLLLGGEIPLTQEERRIARKWSGDKGNRPVVVIYGQSAPRLVGTPWHYENKRGDWIHHPNAYRAAWGKPIYIASEMRTEVGHEWVERHLRGAR